MDEFFLEEPSLAEKPIGVDKFISAAFCTSCRACMPCAQGIDVPRIFEIYNSGVMSDNLETAKTVYKEEGHRILQCTQCGTCAIRCERELAIPDLLEEIRPKLEQE